MRWYWITQFRVVNLDLLGRTSWKMELKFESFLLQLHEFGFADRYYQICREHRPNPSGAPVATGCTKEVIAMFRSSGKEASYTIKFRLYEFGIDSDNLILRASMFFQKSGLEFTFGFQNKADEFSTNLAVLSRQIKEKIEPGFAVTPPYPRPDHNGDISQLRAIIHKFVLLIDDASNYVLNASR